GPSDKQLNHLKKESELGVRFRVIVPKGGNGSGARVVLRARCDKHPTPNNSTSEGAEERGRIVVGSAANLQRYDREGKAVPERRIPELDSRRALKLELSCDGEPHEVFGTLPKSLAANPGSSVEYVLFASRGVNVEGVAIVPLADELPPPPPEPWRPSSSAAKTE
ncbi:MAG TPA: hypothetical protein VFQ61_35185, partial [Polyangiaceae bacterium]|nr:hypothetical protein [Polyangiaceae bacterium]